LSISKTDHNKTEIVFKLTSTTILERISSKTRWTVAHSGMVSSLALGSYGTGCGGAYVHTNSVDSVTCLVIWTIIVVLTANHNASDHGVTLQSRRTVTLCLVETGSA